jgi:SWIM zinc finger
MPRTDLVALTPDDLAELANRGLLKRAQKELEAQPISYSVEESADQTVTVRWNDSAVCTLPPGTVLSDRLCSCSATAICRHLVGAVLAYQQWVAAETTTPTAAPSAWNPGQIADSQLDAFFKKSALNQIRQQYAAGQVIELLRNAKPMARFHTLAHTVRFLVPEDLRYTRCDCTETAPCRHVLMAIWAFRELAEEKVSGLIETGTPPEIPENLLSDLETGLATLLEVGLSGLSAALAARLHRLETQCRNAYLIWPAEILAELLQEYERYSQRDARFSATQAVMLMAELCMRIDAMSHRPANLPQLFVRGSQTDRVSEVGSARLVGLGCGVVQRQRAVRMINYFQDVASGEVIVIARDFPDGENPRTFAELARTSVLKGAAFASLGSGQALIKGGKRTPDHQFLPGRAPATINPQAFAWEQLKAPVLVESLEELQLHLSALPPKALRPRRLGENFYVLPVASVESLEFSTIDQAVRAQCKDLEGRTFWLNHPFTNRSSSGTEALMQQLTESAPRFIAGLVSIGSNGMTVEPTALIFERDQKRIMLQPWISESKSTATAIEIAPSTLPTDPLKLFFEKFAESLAEILVNGFERTDALTFRKWQEILSIGSSLGFLRLCDEVSGFMNAIESKQHILHWESQVAIGSYLRMTILLQLLTETL